MQAVESATVEMSSSAFSSKTYHPADLLHPQVAPVAHGLRRFAFRMGLAGRRFAVNGVLRLRFHVREHKLWEYARGLAAVQSGVPAGVPAFRVLDFGGGATLPVSYLARQGAEVLCLDTDPLLAGWTNQMAAKRGWKLQASTHDLTVTPAPADWGKFDAIISFSVLEHIAKLRQAVLMERLATLLRPGGVLALTFDFGSEAPVADAVRDADCVSRLVSASGLSYLDAIGFQDTGERFALDRRYPGRRFTFASLFLRKETR